MFPFTFDATFFVVSALMCCADATLVRQSIVSPASSSPRHTVAACLSHHPKLHIVLIVLFELPSSRYINTSSPPRIAFPAPHGLQVLQTTLHQGNYQHCSKSSARIIPPGLHIRKSATTLPSITRRSSSPTDTMAGQISQDDMSAFREDAHHRQTPCPSLLRPASLLDQAVLTHRYRSVISTSTFRGSYSGSRLNALAEMCSFLYSPNPLERSLQWVQLHLLLRCRCSTPIEKG